MRFGFGLITCQRPHGETRTDEDLYAEGLELAEEAERLGFDSVWVSEHHFFDDGYMPSVMPMAAAIAARTSRISIGTGLVLAPFVHPLRLAEDAATVDVLARGRFVLGVGLGWREEEFRALGVPIRRRARLLEASIPALKQAWAGELVDGVAVTPLPSREGGPPVWIGAMSEPAVRRAGRIADGFMGTEVTPQAFARQVGWVREELERAGRDPANFEISVHLPTFAWHGDDAWEQVREHHWYLWWKYEDMEAAVGRTPPPPPTPPLPAAREDEMRAAIVLGTPEQVAEQLRAFDDAAGGGLHYIARSYWPGMDPAVQRESMAVFAEEVVPLLRDAPRSGGGDAGRP